MGVVGGNGGNAPRITQPWVLTALRRVVEAERRSTRPTVHHSERLVLTETGDRVDEMVDDEWREAIRQIRRHRLTVLFAAHAGSLQLPDWVAGTLAVARRRQIGEGLIATAHTASLSSALQSAGVDHLVVKGVGLSTLLHDEPSARGVGDIDLWVRPESVGPTEAVLADLGWHRRPDLGRRADPGDGWRWTLYRFALHERAWDGDSRPTVDIHWRLAHRQATLGYDFDEAFARSVAVPAIGPTVRTLCAADALTHMVEHARKEAFPTLRSLVDIVQLADRCGPTTVADMVAGRSPSASNLRFGLVVASTIAPDLAFVRHPTRRQRRLSDRAVDGCLSLELGGNVRKNLAPRERTAISLRHQIWTIVSAPSPLSAVSYLSRSSMAVVGFGTTAWRRR